MFRLIIVALIPLAVGACTITQTVDPVGQVATNEVCIIENPQVREGFLPELQRALQSKNAQVRVLSAQATTTDCLIVTTYVARWKWDLAMYMSYAEINVFHNGQVAGKALYDATHGSGNMGKFIDAEPKIQELVSQLFPTNFPAATADGEIVNSTSAAIESPNQSVAGLGIMSERDLYDEILKLDDLRQRGLITDEEYETEKRELLEEY
jgi:hypothetical protein